MNRVDGVGGVGDRLALRELADEALAGLRERDDRRDRPASFGRCDHGRLAAFHHRDDRVRRAEVDADDLAHGVLFSWYRAWLCGWYVISSGAGFRR
jgi:hypothetical protein